MNSSVQIFLCVLPAVLVFTGCRAREKTAFIQDNDMARTKITLKNAKAQKVWDVFRQISTIPRCSKNEGQIVDWLKDLATNRNLVSRTDAVGNTVIDLPATKGFENSPVVTLQSHVDMVCEKTPESKHDFTKDPIELVERDGWITANGTTLGADNGAGVSLSLALIDEKIQHATLELLFTVDEETGLTGANGLQPGFITGQYLINLDGEDESIIAGCAGGEQTEITLPVEFADAPSDSKGSPQAGLDCFTLKVSGLTGGHSGVDIDKKRANAIKLLAQTLSRLQDKVELHICSIDAGKAANAIPRDAQSVVLINPSQTSTAMKILAVSELEFKNQFSKTDPNLKIEFLKSSAVKKILNHKSEIINLLLALLTGVYRMSDEFKGVVETSDNLARVETISDKNILHITTMQRSFKMSAMDELTSKITSIAESAGAKAVTGGRYPSWQPDLDSSLLKKAKEVFKKVHKEEPKVIVVHAGLECAIIGEKKPGFEMISTGPTIENLHSPGERLNIASIDAAWKFLLELLLALK